MNDISKAKYNYIYIWGNKGLHDRPVYGVKLPWLQVVWEGQRWILHLVYKVGFITFAHFKHFFVRSFVCSFFLTSQIVFARFKQLLSCWDCCCSCCGKVKNISLDMFTHAQTCSDILRHAQISNFDDFSDFCKFGNFINLAILEIYGILTIFRNFSNISNFVQFL